jgi:hypothetical protein
MAQERENPDLGSLVSRKNVCTTPAKIPAIGPTIGIEPIPVEVSNRMALPECD